ncbi:hypothetical protein [Nonomuraea candida]|uniref:hypothetical protein n=1 Tax=Nonomuraea candida TaxID=359159 RepID=UPI000693ABBC|nr:hypothetical protein [Nonomuraea candida]
MLTPVQGAGGGKPARPEEQGRSPSAAARRTGPIGRVFQAVVSAHLAAIVAQPVFAGVYLSGDFDGLRWHGLGADVASSIGYAQAIVAVAVWVRLRRAGPFVATAGVVAAETVQYFAGLDGALWLHVPLGVMTIAALVVQFVAVWRRPLLRREARDARA